MKGTFYEQKDLRSTWRGEAENVTVSFRHLFMANSKDNWSWVNLCKWSTQNEVCFLPSHMPQTAAVSDKPEMENEAETFVRTRNKHDSVWQERSDYSQADYTPEHEERSPFSDLGMDRHRNPTWKEKKKSPLIMKKSIAKMKSMALTFLRSRNESLCPARFSNTGWQGIGNGCAPHTTFPDRNLFTYYIFSWGHALAKKDQHGFDRWHIKEIFQYFVQKNVSV